MLGNDLYKIEGINDISSSELKALILLYKEIIGNDAICLFISFIYQTKTDFNNLSTLLNNLNISLDNFEALCHLLERVDLLATYNKLNQYIFVLKKPLAYENFFNHSIFGRLLLKKVNHEYFCYLKSLSIVNGIDKSDYQDISVKERFSELDNWTLNNEDDFNVHIPKKDCIKKIDSYFDVERFLKSISNSLFPHSLRTYENLSELARLADTYSIKEDDMRRFLKDAISLNPLKFDLNKLNYLCKYNKNNNYVAYEDNKYQTPCTTFLLKLKNGKELVPYDLNIIDNLIHKYHLKPEVVNVLLEYSLKACDNQLLTKFIYAIAANWYNNDIQNYTQALAQLDKVKNYKSDRRSIKKDVLPVYDSSNNIEFSNDDIAKYLKSN